MIYQKNMMNLVDLISIDGSLIDACLSMQWADYRKGAKKAKVHLGFDINHGIPRKVFLTDGKGPERPFVSMILSPGQTGVLDRGYQAHDLFDLWQQEGKHFVCRIKGKTKKKCIEIKDINPDSNIFYYAIVLLGTPVTNKTKTPVRLVGYIVDGIKYWAGWPRIDMISVQSKSLLSISSDGM